MTTKLAKSKNNDAMSARKRRNDKELAKLDKAEAKLKAKSSNPGSKNDLLLDAIMKKRKALETQNKLIGKYLRSKSKSKRANLTKQIEESELLPFPYTETGSICVKCLEKKAKLTKVDFLDGSESKTLGGEGKQFVNLPLNVSRTGPRTSLTSSSRVKKWVSSNFAKNLDRVGASVRVKADVSPALPGIPVYFRLIGDSNNAKYSNSTTDSTKRELTRNLNFRDDIAEQGEPWPVVEVTNQKGIAIARLQVSQAGGNKYEVEAKTLDGTKKKGTAKIKTDRLVCFKEFKMNHVDVKPISASVGKYVGEFGKHKITLENLSRVMMTHIPNVDMYKNIGDFKVQLESAFDGSNAKIKLPYVIAIAYTDHLAIKRENQLLTKLNALVGPGKPMINIKVETPGNRVGDTSFAPRPLWKNLVPGEEWWNSCVFTPEGGGTPIDIAEAKCVPFGGDEAYWVQVDVTTLPAGKGTIDLNVNVVEWMAGGLAFGGTSNVICVCTRAWWKPMPITEQECVLNHEMGHKIQMVADGQSNRPDKVSTHYDSSKGHIGNHCFFGCAPGQTIYATVANHAISKCVMYGQVNKKTEFCTNCAPAIIKVDLRGGWSSI